MDGSSTNSDRRVASIIHHRVGAGENELVAGWQQMLAGLLEKMAPYLTAGRLVTFHTLLPDEKSFFETLHASVDVPGHVTALFISPSVREQMMGGPRRTRPVEPRRFRVVLRMPAFCWPVGRTIFRPSSTFSLPIHPTHRPSTFTIEAV